MNPGPARPSAAPIAAAPMSTAPPTPADKAPTARPQLAPTRFADLLKRSRGEAPTPPAPAPVAPPSPQDEAADRTDPQDASSIESKAVAGTAAKARAATPRRATGMAVVDNDEHKSEKTPGEGDDRGGERTSPTAQSVDRIDARPTVAIAVAATDGRQQPPRAGVAQSDGAAESGDTRDDAKSSDARPTQRGIGHARGMASIDAADERRASVATTSRDPSLSMNADASPALHGAVAEAMPLPAATAAASPADRAVDALTASFAAGASTRSADTTAPWQAAANLALTTPIDAPDFPAAFGVQVSLLAQDGVQQAELRLNPAEMGPVSIHISLDGTAARVDFGADVAATREAIERGLPELASALRDAGFTLAGGGVSQHAGGRPTADDEPAGGAGRLEAGGSAARPEASAAPARPIRAVAAGGVDLYA